MKTNYLLLSLMALPLPRAFGAPLDISYEAFVKMLLSDKIVEVQLVQSSLDADILAKDRERRQYSILHPLSPDEDSLLLHVLDDRGVKFTVTSTQPGVVLLSDSDWFIGFWALGAYLLDLGFAVAIIVQIGIIRRQAKAIQQLTDALAPSGDQKTPVQTESRRG